MERARENLVIWKLRWSDGCFGESCWEQKFQKTVRLEKKKREEKRERREDMLVHLNTLSELRRGVNEM